MAADGLIALKTAPAPVDAEDAEYLARTLYGVAAQATLLAGERDRNFRLATEEGRDYILKVIDSMADAATVECQSLVLTHLREQDPGLPVPRIIPTVGNAPLGQGMVRNELYRVRLMQFLPGDLAAHVAPDTAPLGAIGQMIARLDRALCGFFHGALAQPIVWDVRRAPALLAHVDYLASARSRRLVREALEPFESNHAALGALRSQAIHGDCHPHNLLVTKKRDACSGILDFGDMVHAPLVLEPAVAMAEFLAQGVSRPELVAGMLAGYCCIQPLESVDVDVLYDLITARIATNLLIHAWRCRHDPAGAEALTESVVLAEEALGALIETGRSTLTGEWHRAAGTAAARGWSMISSTEADRGLAEAALLERRRRLLGANAELSYIRPLQLVRGSGVWVYTADGQSFLDVYNNVPHVGHAHPAVVNAIHSQARRIASNTRYLDETVLDYAERLTATLPGELDACLFVNSGSEANDIAWRIAQSHTGSAGALVMTHAYHGITEAVTALSPALRPGSPPYVECLAAPPGSGAIANSNSAKLSELGAGDVERALAALNRRDFGLAAFMVDSAFTSNGVYDPPHSWISPIAAAVHDAGGLIIGDEVQFGLGRSGTNFWGFARRGYLPDIVTLGKPVGNGYPLGVVITRRDILESFQARTGFFSTFGGNPVSAAAGLAVLEVLEREQLVSNAHVTGLYFKERLQQIAAKYATLGEVRGCGLLYGVDVRGTGGAPAPQRTRIIVNGLRERGILIGSEGPHASVLKLRPPMPFAHEHVDLVADALTDVLSSRALCGED